MTLSNGRISVRSVVAVIFASCLAPLGADAAEWGARVVDFSSQWTKDGSPKWYAIQALGAPDTNSCGDIKTAWAGSTENAVAESITVGYDTVVKATGFSIHETYKAPFVAKVEYIEPSGTPHIVWQGNDNTPCPGYLTIEHAATSYPVNAIRVTTRAVPGWKEIDAVRLDGNPVGGGGGGGGSVCPPDCYVSPIGSDTNSGSRSAPWRTINRAASIASAGTTVHVAPGIYNETVTLKRSGTSSKRIRFTSDIKWGAKIWPRTDVTRSQGIIDIPASYVDFDGFDLGPGGSNYVAVGADVYGRDTRFSHNKIHDINVAGTGLGSCLGVGGSGNVIEGNSIYNCGNDEFDHGIYVYDGDSSIVNNVVSNVSGFGIHLWHSPHDVRIINNTSVNNGLGGITVGAGESNAIASNCIVANNITYGNGSHGGIQEAGSVSNNIYINNLSQDGIRLKDGRQSGTIKADPKFVRYKADGTGDYHLQPTSPAINKASVTYAPTADLDGNHRRIGSGPDIGAFEFQP